MLRSLWMLILVLTSPNASAAGPEKSRPDFARTGFYALLGFDIGVPSSDNMGELNRELENGTGPVPAAGATLLDTEYSLSNFLGTHLAVGYRLHPRLAVEGAFTWMSAELYADAIDVRTPSAPVSVSEKRAELRDWWTGLNAKAFLLTGRTQPFALVGIGVQQISRVERGGRTEETTNVGWRFGGGLDVYLTPSIAIDAALTYDLGMGGASGTNVTTLAIALLYRF